MGKDRLVGMQYRLNRFDLSIRHHRQSIPTFPKNPHKAPRIAHLNVACTVHCSAQKEIPREQGDAGAMPEAAASGPHIDLGQK